MRSRVMWRPERSSLADASTLQSSRAEKHSGRPRCRLAITGAHELRDPLRPDRNAMSDGPRPPAPARPRMRWWILPVGVLTLALAWIVGVRVLLLLSGPPRQDFGAQIRGMTRPGSGMRLVGADPLDSTYHMLRAASGDTVLASPEDFRHQRLRVRTHDGREGVWYLEGTPDLFGHRLPPGDEDVVIQGGGLDNAP